jgi:hypothetical protein
VYKETWNRFYLAKQKPTEGKGWLLGTQLVLMTSAGRLLGGTVKSKDGLAPALQQVLDDYAKLPEEERRPKTVEGEVKPVPAPPAGGLVLTIYDRPLGRTEAGSYRLPEGQDLGGLRTEAPHGQRSSLWLTEEEWQSLIPANPQEGATHAVPTKLAKRIFLFGLVPQTLWVVENMWQPNSHREGDLKLAVEDVSAQTIQMRIHGSVVLVGKNGHTKEVKEGETRYEAKLEGTIVYDRVQKRITRWDMAALGDYSGEWFAGHVRWKEATREAPMPLGFSFELDRRDYVVPAENRRPASFVHAYIFKNREQYYWDPEKWEADWLKQQKR